MSSVLGKFFQHWFGASEQPVMTAPPAEVSSPSEVLVHHAAEVASEAPLIIAALADAPAQAHAIALAAQPEQKPLTAWKPLIPVDHLFFDWLMGYPGEGSNFEVEQKVLQALYGLLASDLNDAVLVPRMPSVIPALLSSLRNKSVSAGEISRHIVKDVVLVGEVINVVNSAMYNPADRINSLEKAVMLLGEDGLRLLIAKVAFNPIINMSSGKYTRRAAQHIWSQSEKCAIACHHLAKDVDPFQAFLTGLMKNMGLVICFRMLDHVCAEVKFKYSSSFQLAFASVATTLSYRIAQRWGFPAYVVQALQQQAGGSKPIAWTPLGHLLHTADLLSKMRILVNHGQLMSNDERLKMGLDSQAADCFDLLNQLQLHDLADAQKNVSQNKLP
jgi:HD-like signal output (HDOD) protein